MEEELEWRMTVVRPQILEDVKFARSHGDLSENFEYKAAKRERGKNESRIRYLRNMIKTAIIIKDTSTSDSVGLFDTVTYYMEEDNCEEQVKIVTTLRRDPFQNIISKRHQTRRAFLFHCQYKRVGDRVAVKVSDDYSYFIEIRAIEKGKDDESLEIRKF